MNNIDVFGLSLRNLMRRKTRTLLAVVGVIVGTCAIVVMVSIGFGLSASVQAQIESQGNLHLVDVYPGGGGMVIMGGNGSTSVASGAGGQKSGVLDDKAIAAIGKLSGVEAVSGKLETSLTFISGKYIMQGSVIGLDPAIMQKFHYKVQDGRLLAPGDKFAVVFGNQLPATFYNPKKSQSSGLGMPPKIEVLSDKIAITADDQYGQKPVQGVGGETEKINYKEYKGKGVGVLANPDDMATAYTVYMPLDTVKTIRDDTAKARKEQISRNKGYDSAMVYVGDLDKVLEVSDAIRNMGFQASSLNDWLKSMQDQAKMTQGILGGIGAISLFVAALGIANTMIMSIYERTKEIGVMKVIGANLTDIKKMFLLEAGLIGFFGGILGLGISSLISFLMNTVLAPIMSKFLGGMGSDGSVISIIPWWVTIGAVAFATLIGIISGYYPARRAMKLSALESLRNE